MTDWAAIVTPALTGLLGVALGGFLQQWGDRSRRIEERNERRRAERLSAYHAYVTYLRTIPIDLQAVIGDTPSQWRDRLDAFLRDSLERRTALALQSSDAVWSMVEGRAASLDSAFTERLASVIPDVVTRLESGELQSADHVTDAVRNGIFQGCAELIKPLIQDLLKIMREDLRD